MISFLEISFLDDFLFLEVHNLYKFTFLVFWCKLLFADEREKANLELSRLW